MPGGERPREPSSDSAETSPYYQAARFPSERASGRAYARAQRTIFEADCDLSAFRLQLDRRWHVVVLGQIPPEALDRAVRQVLAAGESVSLSEQVLNLLFERRLRSIKQGPWVERHFRPGQPL